MRCDQPMGLHENAYKILNLGNHEVKVQVKGVKIYPDGKEVPFEETTVESMVQVDIYGHYSGMFDTEYPLRKYTFPNGEAYREFLQADPWSGGPVMFLALQRLNGKGDRWEDVLESFWPQEEIDRA